MSEIFVCGENVGAIKRGRVSTIEDQLAEILAKTGAEVEELFGRRARAEGREEVRVERVAGEGEADKPEAADARPGVDLPRCVTLEV